jgi:uncharacterized integral membrane protein (TIGR00698 family)
MKKIHFAKIIFPVAALLCLFPFVSSGVALVLGLALALIVGNPYQDLAKKWTPKLLGYSVMGLGAGMNLAVIGQVGLQGVSYTIIGILTAITVGTLLGKLLKVEEDTSLLISIGTAICGGSAIAAVSPVIRAKHHEVSVSLGIVFMLNAAALFIFPLIGHALGLDQTQFGLWSALAIHDTSSVVGATMQYGAKALEVGTTVKLARALWIIPVAMIVGMIRARKNSSEAGPSQKAKKPWFILWFIIAAALVTYFPDLAPYGHKVEALAKRMMVLTLFLIGSGLSRETIKSVGVKPFIQGICLWGFMASASLLAIKAGLIH